MRLKTIMGKLLQIESVLEKLRELEEGARGGVISLIDHQYPDISEGNFVISHGKDMATLHYIKGEGEEPCIEWDTELIDDSLHLKDN